MTHLDKPRLNTISEIINDFSAAPFRLFFLSACVIGICAAWCWSLFFLGWWQLSPDPLNLHAYWFLQSLGGAAYAGFLFTAIPEWTHDKTILTRYMQHLWILWLIATVLATFSIPIALLIMLFFWTYLGLLATWLVWKNRDDRQFAILTFIFATLAISSLISVSAWRMETINPYYWQQQLHLSLLGIALITFRISRALGTQALEDAHQFESRFIPNPFYKNLAVWLFYLLIIHNITIQQPVIEGWLSLAISGVMIGRLREWHFMVLLKQHYSCWLYLTLLLIGIGYGWRGVALIGIGHSPLLNPTLPLHLIAIGGFLLMIYQVFNIAGLRHSNINLIYPQSSRLGLICLLIAALSRSIGASFSAHYTWFVAYIPCGLLTIAFIVYLPVFYRLFLRYAAILPDED